MREAMKNSFPLQSLVPPVLCPCPGSLKRWTVPLKPNKPFPLPTALVRILLRQWRANQDTTLRCDIFETTRWP